jgi:hypothetical protein
MGPLSTAHAGSEPSDIPPQFVATMQNLAPGTQFQFIAHAVGIQRYTCQADGTWSKKSVPTAVLSEDGQPTIDHFAGPTWQSRQDQSAVKGAVVTPQASPDPKAIPWLLLSTQPTLGTTRGDGGNLSDITFIVRMHTTEGVAPTLKPNQTCGVTGSPTDVNYTADYVFYAAH